MQSGKGSSTSTTQQTPTALPQYNALMSRIMAQSNQPYTPYGGELVAGLNQNEYQGINQLNSAYGSAQPYINAATQYAALGASPIQASAIQNYSNPYQSMVTNATMNQLQNTEQANNTQAMGSTLGSGGLFNDRAGVMQGQLSNQESLANAQALGGLNTANYNQALTAAQGDRSAAAQAAYTFGNLGQENLQSILQGANATLSAGQLQQQQQQALDTSNYGQWQNQQAFPYQQLSWATGLGTGLGSQMGGNSQTTSTPAQPNPWNQALGLGMFGLGMFGAKDGGRIPEMAAGGTPFGGDGGMFGGEVASTPFASASGYIPKGGSMPTQPWGIKTPSPSSPSSQQQDPFKALTADKNAGKGLSNLGDKFNNSSMGDTFNDTMQDAMDDFGENRGGRIPHRLGGGIVMPPGFADGGFPMLDDGDMEGGYEPDIGAFTPHKGMNAPISFMPSTTFGPKDDDRGLGPGTYSLGDMPPGFNPTRSDANRIYDEPENVLPRPRPHPGEDLETPAPDLPPAREVPGGPTAVADASLGSTGSLGRERGLGDVRLPEAHDEHSNALRNAMMTAGMGLMASRSPYLGSAIGEAGLAGLSAYSGTQKTEEGKRREVHKEALDEKKYQTQLDKLDQAAARADRDLNLKTQNAADLKDYRERQLQQGRVPPGFRATKDGMEPTPGGPHDPKVIQATEEAKTAAKNGTGMTPEAKEVMARAMIGGNYQGYNSLGRTAAGLKVRDELNNMATEIVMRERGASAQQAAQFLNEQKQEFGARQIGLNTEARTTSQREANLNLILKVADAAVPAALQLNEEATRLGGPIVPLNRIIQKGEVMTSDPIQARFGVANLQLAESWARAMNPTGVMRDADRDLALKHLDTGLSTGTYKAVVQQIQEQIKRERDSIRGLPPNTPLNLSATTPQLGTPSGATPAGGAPAAPTQGAPQVPQAPPRPAGVAPGSQYSPSRQQWRTPDGHIYDAKGAAVQ